MRGLKGKTAIVTGGAAGIGRSIVQRFEEEGTKVVVFDLNGPDNIARVAYGEPVGTLIAGPATAGAPA